MLASARHKLSRFNSSHVRYRHGRRRSGGVRAPTRCILPSAKLVATPGLDFFQHVRNEPRATVNQTVRTPFHGIASRLSITIQDEAFHASAQATLQKAGAIGTRAKTGRALRLQHRLPDRRQSRMLAVV